MHDPLPAALLQASQTTNIAGYPTFWNTNARKMVTTTVTQTVSQAAPLMAAAPVQAVPVAAPGLGAGARAGGAPVMVV